MWCCLASKSEPSQDTEEYANDFEEPPKKKHAPAKKSKRVSKGRDGPIDCCRYWCQTCIGSQGKYIDGNELQKGLPQEAQDTNTTKNKGKAKVGTGSHWTCKCLHILLCYM